MSELKTRRLKLITLALGGDAFECQLKSWKLDTGEEDGERLYSYCPDGVTVEETDDDPTLELELFSDWRSGGISDYLWQHRKEIVEWTIDHHPDIPGEHVRWSGTLKVKAPPAGGEVRTTEMSSVTLQVITLNPMERP